MAITYAWVIRHIMNYPSFSGKENVVCKIQWQYRGVDETGTASVRGDITDVEFQPNQPFTPFEDLTENQVLSWIIPNVAESKIAQMQSEIAEDIAHQHAIANTNTPVLARLPWIKGPPDLSNLD